VRRRGATGPSPPAHGYIGERYDDAAGLQYLNARYYDPRLAMFIQPDWWEVTQAGVGTNRYSYSFGDPVNGRDPGGNSIFTRGFIKEGINAAIEKTAKVIAKSVAQSGGRTGLKNTASRIVQRVQQAMDDLDTFNATMEGDWVGVALSQLPGMEFPYIAKIAKVEMLAKRAELALDALRNRGKLNGILKRALGAPKAGQSAHHVIPAEALDNDFVQKALEGGFDFNGVENGMWAVQNGSHKTYNRKVQNTLDVLAENYPDATPEQASELLKDVADDLKDKVDAAGGVVE